MHIWGFSCPATIWKINSSKNVKSWIFFCHIKDEFTKDCDSISAFYFFILKLYKVKAKLPKCWNQNWKIIFCRYASFHLNSVVTSHETIALSMSASCLVSVCQCLSIRVMRTWTTRGQDKHCFYEKREWKQAYNFITKRCLCSENNIFV